jgi:hypothetical protein
MRKPTPAEVRRVLKALPKTADGFAVVPGMRLVLVRKEELRSDELIVQEVCGFGTFMFFANNGCHVACYAADCYVDKKLAKQVLSKAIDATDRRCQRRFRKTRRASREKGAA